MCKFSRLNIEEKNFGNLMLILAYKHSLQPEYLDEEQDRTWEN